MPARLSIGDVADRSGVPAATLRSWEARYGFPEPHRQAGGHRRYAEHDVELVEQVIRHRADGLSLPTAIRRAVAGTEVPEQSVFAALRRRHRNLNPQLLSKATLLALTRAMEDECCARAERPVLFASFQRERFYRQSQARWVELARTSQTVVVFADFDSPTSGTGRGSVPLRVRVARDAPLRREWLLICDAPDYPACLAGWEPPGQQATPEAERRFETVWSLDPQAVRDAALTAASLATAFAPRLKRRMAAALTGNPGTASTDLHRATGLLTRMVGYLDQMPR